MRGDHGHALSLQRKYPHAQRAPTQWNAMHNVASMSKPIALISRYLWRHRIAHALVILAILGAVAASVAARYSMKFIVDAMTEDRAHLAGVWQAVLIFTACVGADNVLWRVAGWAGASAFPAIGAELRLDLFSHLLGQSNRYFNERFSGALAGRVSTAANGVFTLENTFTWNVLPAAAATLGAVIGLGTVRWEIAAALAVAAAAIALGIAYAAARGGPLNHAFAERAAEVSGEIVDAVTNHSIVRVFANRARETARLEQALAAENVATLTVPHDMADDRAATSFRCGGGMIVFDNVSFGHEHSHVTLDGVSLRIPAGQSVGVVGPSGAGKSTLLALLQRLYPTRSGRILIDGQDIAALRQDSLRRAIALVPQDISLFHRSILENIRYGRPDATDAEVMAAARAARCEDFIARLPEGYATLVGERGVRLSVGQKQRVAIARALLADAPIILLDEATSALDTESEVAVQQALSELMRHRRGTFARLWQAQTDESARDAMTEEWWSRLPPPDHAAAPKAAVNSARR